MANPSDKKGKRRTPAKNPREISVVQERRNALLQMEWEAAAAARKHGEPDQGQDDFQNKRDRVAAEHQQADSKLAGDNGERDEPQGGRNESHDRCGLVDALLVIVLVALVALVVLVVVSQFILD
ncbi:hypothetical protein SELMODRAFT_423873 [Selaginella moellendorffii]|uniref:Uncharacterized protein n=1 Tax=Selaginella moellendorffii TaxID=88036 RepID=D8SN30_SELML|nr:hypothetical protein SELMODRAFT_423873 [Selaginella moellendorffii]